MTLPLALMLPRAFSFCRLQLFLYGHLYAAFLLLIIRLLTRFSLRPPHAQDIYVDLLFVSIPARNTGHDFCRFFFL